MSMLRGASYPAFKLTLWRILRQNPPRTLGCSELQEPPKKLTRFWCAKSRMRRNDTPGRIVTNVCTDVGVHNVITCADLYDYRLRCLGVAGVKFWPSPLTSFVTLTTLSHYRVRVCDCLFVLFVTYIMHICA